MHSLSEDDEPVEEEVYGGDDEGQLPAPEPLHGNVLDLPGRPQRAHVDGGEPAVAHEVHDAQLGRYVVSGHEDLLAALDASGLECVGRQDVEGLDHWRVGEQGLEVLCLGSDVENTRDMKI